MRSFLLFLSLLILIIASSCSVKHVPVGNYENIDCKPIVLKEDKDLLLFWDLVTVRRTEKGIKVKDYEKVSRRKFFDNVVFYGTAGIFSFYSVKIYVKDCDSEDLERSKKEEKRSRE